MSIELERHHYEWILNGAYEHFAEKVQDLEIRLAAHETFKQAPHYHPNNPKQGDRTEHVADLERYLVQYRNILAYLVATLHELRNVNAEESAKGFAEFMRERHGLTPKKKKAPKRAKR